MSPGTRFGEQPIAAILREQGVTIAEAATRLDVPRAEVLWPVIGIAPPTRRLARKLGRLTGRHVWELFTERSLALRDEAEAHAEWKERQRRYGRLKTKRRKRKPSMAKATSMPVEGKPSPRPPMRFPGNSRRGRA